MMRQPESITASVVEKIAEAEGVGMYDVAPLIETVDPDALEKIFADRESSEDVRIEFSHCGYRIAIDGGRVSVETPADHP